MNKFSQKSAQIIFCIAATSQVFSLTFAERRQAFKKKETAPAPVLNGKKDANAVLGKSVKTAEVTTKQLFTQHYITAAHDATLAKRQQINLWRIKRFQTMHTTPAFFNSSTTGVKAKPDNFSPLLDAANIAMATAYAPYNNCSRISTSDVAAFAAKYPHEVTGLNLKSLEGDLLPPNTKGKAFAYNPFSYGMVLVYRLRHANKLGGESATAIDLYNKEKAFEWEAAAGIAKESVGTGTAHNVPAAAPSPAKSAPAQPHVNQAQLNNARTALKSRNVQPPAKSGSVVSVK